nr:MAG TPA: hypothetical protein [Caudoviricetes sp.]
MLCSHTNIDIIHCLYRLVLYREAIYLVSLYL